MGLQGRLGQEPPKQGFPGRDGAEVIFNLSEKLKKSHTRSYLVQAS